jgi:hypothetical protein
MFLVLFLFQCYLMLHDLPYQTLRSGAQAIICLQMMTAALLLTGGAASQTGYFGRKANYPTGVRRDIMNIMDLRPRHFVAGFIAIAGIVTAALLMLTRVDTISNEVTLADGSTPTTTEDVVAWGADAFVGVGLMAGVVLLAIIIWFAARHAGETASNNVGEVVGLIIVALVLGGLGFWAITRIVDGDIDNEIAWRGAGAAAAAVLGLLFGAMYNERYVDTANRPTPTR